MRRLIFFVATALLLNVHFDLLAQQTEFPIGVYTYLSGNLDFDQMRDELNLTWVQGFGGFGSGTNPWNHSAIEMNSAGLKVMTVRDTLQAYTKSQRLEIQAEDPSSNGGTRAWFTRTPITPIAANAGNDRTAWHTTLGTNPGYMASNLSVTAEYHYQRTSYIATFVMRITKAAPATDQVATLSVVNLEDGSILSTAVLKDSDFGIDYKAFEVPFTIRCSPPSLPSKYLAGVASTIQSTPPCTPQIDVRVYWNGAREAWLDKVYIEDDVAHKLFPREGQSSGSVDNVLVSDASDFQNTSTYSTVKRLEFAGEPYVNAFKSFNYVDTKLQTSLPGLDPTSEGRCRGITPLFWSGNNLTWYLQAAQPHELLVDSYVIRSDVPSPSMRTGQDATDAGVVPYQNNTQYDVALQSKWEILEGGLSDVAQQAKTFLKNVWFVPQLHGEYIEHTGKYVKSNGDLTLRPPTGAEIQAEIGIALAFGVTGIIAYPFATDYYKDYDGPGSDGRGPGLVSTVIDANGKLTDHSSNYGTLPLWPSGTKTIYTGYQEKWAAFAAMTAKLKLLAPTLLSLTWQEAKSWKSGTVYPTGAGWSGIVSTVSTKNTSGTTDALPEVLTGRLIGNGAEYLYVVNRRCDASNSNMDTRDMSLTLNNVNAYWLVTDVLSNSSWAVAGGTAFTDRFNPGEGKLYKLTPKIHLTTSTSISYGSQPKIARSWWSPVGGKAHVMAYESGGDIYYTWSSDGGTTWLPEQLVSPGNGKASHPSIESVHYTGAQSGAETYVVWEENPVNSTGYRIWLRKRDDVASTWQPATILYEDPSARPASALPVISYAFVYWKGPNSILWHGGLLSSDPTTYPTNSVPGTDANSNSPSVDMDGVYVNEGTAQLAWEQIGTGIRSRTGYVNWNGTSNWNALQSIANDASSQTNTRPVIVRDSSGNSCIAWEYRNSAISQGNIKFMKITSTGTLLPVITFFSYSGSGHYAYSPSLTGHRYTSSSSKDDLTLTWHTPQDGIECAMFRTGSWSTPFILSTTGQYGTLNKVNYPGDINSRIAMVIGTTGTPYSIQLVPVPAIAPIPAKPVLISPANGSTGVDVTPILTWNSSPGAATYRLEVSWYADFSSLIYDFQGLTETYQQISLGHSVPPYWRVNAANATGTSPWSDVWHFTTAAPPPPPPDPCPCCLSSLASLDQFTVSDAYGNGQMFFVGNGDRGYRLGFSDFTLPTPHAPGLFHARFHSGNLIETATHLNSVFPIDVQDAIYPLNVSWSLRTENGISYSITASGTQGKVPLNSQSGSMSLAGSDNGVLLLTTQTSTPSPCDPYATRMGQNGLLEKAGQSIPKVYLLRQNSPNPFNPRTTIGYDLPEDARVTLKIFNMLGEEVKMLVDGVESAGYKSVSFDASSFASGMYFYRLQAGTFSDVKKLLLLK